MCCKSAPLAGHSLAMHGSLQAHKAVHVHVQAVVNEDLSGEAAAMLAEIARLSAQNASLRSEVALLQQARTLHALHPPFFACFPCLRLLRPKQCFLLPRTTSQHTQFKYLHASSIDVTSDSVASMQ